MSNFTFTTKAAAVAAVSVIAFAGCKDDNDVHAAQMAVSQVKGQTMGTFYSVQVPKGYTGGNEALDKRANSAFNVVIDAISTFDDSAELARFNAYKGTDKFEISPYLADSIENAIFEAHRIEDAMDITVGPLVNLWGFGPDGRLEKQPQPDDIAKAKALTGYDKFALYRDAQTDKAYLQKVDGAVKLDMSTLGEGLGADLLATYLDEDKVENYMIAVAGAIRTKGKNSKGADWTVGIEDPFGKGVFEVACPKGMAMSTAGSYRNFFIDENTKEVFSHIIDTKTGYPVAHKTVSVTVIAPTAATTDALDTGLLVLGAQKALDFGNKHNVAVYTIEIDDKGQAVGRYSKAFEPYLKCNVR